jgi:hypothetical protein
MKILMLAISSAIICFNLQLATFSAIIYFNS